MHSHQHKRPRSRTSGGSQCVDPCHVSECWTNPVEQAPFGARPLGTGIEKVLEYRTVRNGRSVELRRVTPSAQGPVEHIQVVQAKPEDSDLPWLDYEGHPAQVAATWSHSEPRARNGHYRKLAMNGSQPCLINTSDEQTQYPERRSSGLHTSHPCLTDQFDPAYLPPPAHHPYFAPHFTLYEQPTTHVHPPCDGFQGQNVFHHDQSMKRSSSRPASSMQQHKKKQKASFRRSESFTGGGDSVPVNGKGPPRTSPAPRSTSRNEMLIDSGMSPLAVVRNKRANQAHWESQQRRRNSSSSVKVDLLCGGNADETDFRDGISAESNITYGANIISAPLLGNVAGACMQGPSDCSGLIRDVLLDGTSPSSPPLEKPVKPSSADVGPTGRRRGGSTGSRKRKHGQQQLSLAATVAAAAAAREQQDTPVDSLGEGVIDFDQYSLDLDLDQVPPPPSPPCTCGKNLLLPPSPPLDSDKHTIGFGK